MHDYDVNQQVVCVDTKWVNDTKEFRYPVLNGIYTIRQIVQPTTFNITVSGFEQSFQDEIAFRFYEIASVGCFYHWHFKPIRKTDISDLVKLSKPVDITKKRVLEDA